MNDVTDLGLQFYQEFTISVQTPERHTFMLLLVGKKTSFRLSTHGVMQINAVHSSLLLR